MIYAENGNWPPYLETAFQKSILEIIRVCERGLRSFDPAKPTALAKDYSKWHQGSGLHKNIVSVYRSKSNQVAADKAGRQFSVVAVSIAVLRVAMHQSKVRPWQHSGP